MRRGPFLSSLRKAARSGWLDSGSFVVTLLLACLLSVPSVASAQEIVTASPNKVKAAFLRNFAHYVTWPENAFLNAKAPWKIGVLGEDPFGDVLEKTLKGRTEQGRSFEICRAATIEELPPCNIVFVAISDSAQRRAALKALRQLPVLTVGDDPDFMNDGGIIRFRLQDTLLIDINLDQAQVVSLDVQTKILEIASMVLDKGKLRRLR